MFGKAILFIGAGLLLLYLAWPKGYSSVSELSDFSIGQWMDCQASKLAGSARSLFLHAGRYWEAENDINWLAKQLRGGCSAYLHWTPYIPQHLPISKWHTYSPLIQIPRGCRIEKLHNMPRYAWQDNKLILFTQVDLYRPFRIDGCTSPARNTCWWDVDFTVRCSRG